MWWQRARLTEMRARKTTSGLAMLFRSTTTNAAATETNNNKKTRNSMYLINPRPSTHKHRIDRVTEFRLIKFPFQFYILLIFNSARERGGKEKALMRNTRRRTTQKFLYFNWLAIDYLKNLHTDSTTSEISHTHTHLLHPQHSMRHGVI